MESSSVTIPVLRHPEVFPLEKLDTHIKHSIMLFLDISK